MTPLKAIRVYCLDCCGGQSKEVKLCPCENCPLWQYRLGKNPARAGIKNSGSFAKTHGSTGDLEHAPCAEGNYIPTQSESGKEAPNP